MLRYDNKVIVITGSGNGLGKKYALFFAKRGAKVVVNDISKNNGVYSSDIVRDEIIKMGYEAISDHNDVLNGKLIIKNAINKFGRVDILINNAGIIRDASFKKMTDKQWYDVINVHLNGCYELIKAAWPYFINQKYGRIINTTSGSGLYGNFGQANYSAAKLGIHGLTQVIAKEGKSKNVLCNTIAPLAYTSMTEEVFNKEMKLILQSENIVPFVAYLAHEKITETGSVFEIGGGTICKVTYQRNEGVNLQIPYTPEDVEKNFDKILSFKGENTHPQNTLEFIKKVIKNHKIISQNPKL